jgi:hypothetical protein
MRGRALVPARTPIVLQVANNIVISLCDKCAVKSKCKHVLFVRKIRRYAFCVRFCNGNATCAYEGCRQ